MPANFPPSGTRDARAERDGHARPARHLRHVLVLHVATRSRRRRRRRGRHHRTRSTSRDGVVRGALEGPDNPFLDRAGEGHGGLRRATSTPSRTFAKIVVGGEERLLRVGEWSDWVPVRASAWRRGRAARRVPLLPEAARPGLRAVRQPAQPRSAGAGAADLDAGRVRRRLARATGRFYTQGMPEDTKGLKTGVLTPAEFLAAGAHRRRRESSGSIAYVLDRFTDGFLFYYFGNVDQVSHMMWRADGSRASGLRRRGRSAVPRTSSRTSTSSSTPSSARRSRALGPDDLLVVMSDHGFTSWRRALQPEQLAARQRLPGAAAGADAAGPGPRSPTSTGRGRAPTASG